jgi:DNA modification methylase
MGSGTTGIAAISEDCDFIGIEKEKEYYKIAKARIKSEELKHKFF